MTTTTVASAVVEMPRHYVRLALAMAPGVTVSERVTTSRTPPLPINAEARATQEDICALIAYGECWYRRHVGWAPAPDRGRESVALVGGVLFVRAHLDGIMATEWGNDYALDVLRVHRRARRVLGLTKLVHRLPARCPTCETLALVREDGSDRVVCRYCRRWFDEAEYARLVLVLASDL